MHATTTPATPIVLVPIAERAGLTEKGGQVLELVRTQWALPADDTEAYEALERQISTLINS